MPFFVLVLKRITREYNLKLNVFSRLDKMQAFLFENFLMYSLSKNVCTYRSFLLYNMFQNFNLRFYIMLASNL